MQEAHILIIDDDAELIAEWHKQLDALAPSERPATCQLVCYSDPNNELLSLLQNMGKQLTAVFIDFDLRNSDNNAVGAEKLMAACSHYINWDKTRCTWFSGDEELNQAAIARAKEKYPALSLTHLRKPLTLKQMLASLAPPAAFELSPQWQAFPWPLRIIDKQGNAYTGNNLWRTDLNEPDPTLFINAEGFIIGYHEFYGQHPDGQINASASIDNNGTTEKIKFSHYRLVSFPAEHPDYLLQFAEGLANFDDVRVQNNLPALIGKITTALKGYGFSRIRLYRHYLVPRQFDETNEQNEEIGVMPLVFTNTQLNDELQPGNRNEVRSNNAGFIKQESNSWLTEKIAQARAEPEKLVWNINKSKPLQEFDEYTIPEQANNEQCVLELPLICREKVVSEIGHTDLLGMLVADKYDEAQQCYTVFNDDDIERIQHTLLRYCHALVEVISEDIKKQDSKAKLQYADLDQSLLADINRQDEQKKWLLQSLLKKAIEAGNADVGYISEPFDADHYQISVTANHRLFDNKRLSRQAMALPVIRCWLHHKMIALPNLHKEQDIQQAIVATYKNPELVCCPETTDNDDQAEKYFQTEIKSLLALPVFAGNKQIAAIILHSKQPYHFDYQKISGLRYLLTRASWILLLSRQVQDRQLFLDGVIHEIKSDLAPLQKVIEQFCPSCHKQVAYRRLQYSVQRLQMASKNLLFLTRNIPIEASGSSQLIQVLNQLLALYDADLKDKKINSIWKTAKTEDIWQTELAMNEAWLTHVLANVIDNAIKYSKRCQLELKAWQTADKLYFSLSNPGQLTAEAAAKAFEAGFQSSQGTGFHIGLASCRKIMQAHYGDISLNSDNGIISATLSWPLS